MSFTHRKIFLCGIGFLICVTLGIVIGKYSSVFRSGVHANEVIAHGPEEIEGQAHTLYSRSAKANN